MTKNMRCALLMVALATRASAQYTEKVADEVTVVVFIDSQQVTDHCEAVTWFGDRDHSHGLSNRFAGCTATNIPYGTYSIQFRSQLIDTGRVNAGGPRRPSPRYQSECLVDQPRTVCLMHVDPADVIWPE